MSTDAPALLYLVRHGSTPPNERQPNTLQGCGVDLPLSPTGERQAVRVGEFFREFPLRAVYCSPLIRARQTAEAIAGPHGLAVRVEEGIQEADVGDWENLDWGTIARRDPAAYAAFQADPAANPYLGGESYGDVLRRVEPVLNGLLERHRGESIVVVGHNVVNRVYLAKVLGLELRLAKSVHQYNTCVNLIRRDAQGVSLITLNGIFHRAELPG